MPQKLSIADVLSNPEFHALPTTEKVKVLSRIGNGPGVVPTPSGMTGDNPDLGLGGLAGPGSPVDQPNTLGVLRSLFPSIRTEKNPSSNPIHTGDPNIEGDKVANAENATNALSPAILTGGALAATAPVTGPAAAVAARALLPHLAKGVGQSVGMGAGGTAVYALLKHLGIIK